MTTKKQFILTLLIIFALLSSFYLVAGVAFYKFFNDPLAFSVQFPQEVMNSSYIRTQDYNVATLGSCLTNNFICSEVDSVLGGKSFNFSISASAMPNTCFYWENVLRQKKANCFIVDLLPSAFFPNATILDSRIQLDFYESDSYFIYSEIFMSKFLFSEAGIKLLSAFMKKGTYSVKKGLRGRDMIHSGLYKDVPYERKYLANSIFIKKYALDSSEDWPWENIVDNIDQNLIPCIESSGNAQIILFFPPQNILFYKSEKTLDRMQKFKRIMVEKLDKYSNVKLFDFQTSKEVTTNMDIYKDVIHYNKQTNSWMLNEFTKNTYIINKSNIDSCFKKQREMVENYDFDTMLEILKKLLEE